MPLAMVSISKLSLAGAAALGGAVLFFWHLRSKAAALERVTESHRKAQQFDAARNEVLESIAHDAPLPESMERLAMAIEQQFSGSLCAVVMPPDRGSSYYPSVAPILVAPGLVEELQPTFAAAVAAAWVCAERDPAEIVRQQLGERLRHLLRSAGFLFQRVHSVTLFSNTACMSGWLLLFCKDDAASDADAAADKFLNSASRLAALAGNHACMREKLLYEARHDSLTGLANRAVAEDRLEQALARSQRNGKGFAVLCIDLDGFKAINDKMGHEFGDRVLRTVATRLRGRIRHSDTLARMGGDEFWVVLEDCAGGAAAETTAQSLMGALEQPMCLEGYNLKVNASIGIAMYPQDGANATQLKRHADHSMYRAKNLGGHQVSLWSQDAELNGGDRAATIPEYRPPSRRHSAKA